MADQNPKFFRVAVEGGTSDGRTIKREWLEQMAATYNPATYGARINCEHVRGYSPEKPFFAYGDVTALKTEEIDLQIGGKTEKRLALLATMKPNAEAKRINAAGQKIYSSIEVRENFANTNQAYLVGVALTDSPASLGTEIITFAAKASGNVYSEPLETTVEFDEAQIAGDPLGLVSAFKAAIELFKGSPTPPPVQKPEPEKPANDNVALAAVITAMSALPATLEGIVKASNVGLAEVRSDLAKLTAQLATTDADPGKRPPVSGGGNFAKTDC